MAITNASLTEYEALTRAAAFVQRPRPGVLALTGDDAAEFLQGQVTNDVEALKVGEGCYAAFLSPKGKMQTDMRILRTDASLLVITDSERLPIVTKMINAFRIGYAFTIEDWSESIALLSVIGPESLKAVAAITTGADELGSIEDAIVRAIYEGQTTYAITTLVGVDILAAAPTADAISDALDGNGVPQVSDEAAEILRVEIGLPSFDHEIDDNTIPQEAGLNERAVNFEKGCYVGQETVARLHYKGKPNRQLRALKLSAPVDNGAPITAADGRELGRIGTAVLSPVHGALALAILRREAEIGDTVHIADVSAVVFAAGELN